MKLLAKYKLDIPLTFIALLAAFLNGYDIWTDKYANTYYTTAVAAMMQSWHNFFFASLDSAGSVTVDKPPVTFWIQTLSADLFGLHGWSVILPQALAGVGAVLLVYKLVKPTFGLAAARIGALAMACTPIAAAVSRTNNIDSMLVFALLVGTALLFRGVRKGSVWSVLGAFAMVGVGFNMKMLQAFMVLPAFYLFYLLAAKWGWKKKAGILAGATAVLLVVSLSWAVVVDSIPADKRPYIGSSGTNSVLNLAFGYNGVSRLTGDRSTGGGAARDGGFAGQFRQDGQAMQGGQNGTDGQAMPDGGNFRRDGNGDRGFGGGPNGGDGGAGGGPNGGRSGGMFGTGEKGPLRLFQSSLSDQASWLIPFALIGAVGLLAGLRRRNWTDKQRETVFWLAWLLPVMGFFSIAGFFHQYYLIMLAPPIAALAGAGFSEMWQAYRDRTGWTSWLLPAAVLITTAFQWYIMHPYDGTIGGGWSKGVALAGLIVSAALIAWRSMGKSGKLVRIFAVGGLLVLLVGPIYWAATPITYGISSMTPIVGPGSSGGGGGMPGGSAMGRGQGPGSSSGVNEALWTYLKQNNTGERYLVAATDYGTAAPYMIDKGEQVVILNGFNGSDQVYTTATLEALVARGEVKYFLLSGGGMGGGRGGNSELTQWIQEHGTAVSSSEWQTSGTGDSGNSDGFGGRGGSATLYEVSLRQGG